MRIKLLKTESDWQALSSQTKKLQSVITQQKTIITKLKAQRSELLTFYKKHKKFELREAQIDNQKSVIQKLNDKYLETEQKFQQEMAELENTRSQVLSTNESPGMKGSELLKNAAMFKDQQIMRLQKTVDQNRLMIFMQEKLAEMKSKFLTQVAIRVKPAAESVTAEHGENDQIPQESFTVLNTNEMGLAKQIVLNCLESQIVAAADQISQASDTQTEFYEATLAAKVQSVVLDQRSDYVIGLVGEPSSGKHFTLIGMPFNTQLSDLNYASQGYDSGQLKLIEN